MLCPGCHAERRGGRRFCRSCPTRGGRSMTPPAHSAPLRLHETSPQKLITQGTDWRFVNELKGELKT